MRGDEIEPVTADGIRVIDSGQSRSTPDNHLPAVGSLAADPLFSGTTGLDDLFERCHGEQKSISEIDFHSGVRFLGSAV